MSIITRSYFTTGEYQIGNALDPDGNVPDKELLGNGQTLRYFIEKCEREIREKCLGYPLNKLFMEQFDFNGSTGYHTINNDAADKWKELLNGLEYEQAGKTVKWRGLIYKDDIITMDPEEDYMHSFMAAYIYAKYVEMDYRHGSLGFEKDKAKNTLGVDPTVRYVRAINDVYNHVLVSKHNFVSLHEFISDMNAIDPETYPDWEFGEFKLINRYGL